MLSSEPPRGKDGVSDDITTSPTTTTAATGLATFSIYRSIILDLTGSADATASDWISNIYRRVFDLACVNPV